MAQHARESSHVCVLAIYSKMTAGWNLHIAGDHHNQWQFLAFWVCFTGCPDLIGSKLCIIADQHAISRDPCVHQPYIAKWTQEQRITKQTAQLGSWGSFQRCAFISLVNSPPMDPKWCISMAQHARESSHVCVLAIYSKMTAGWNLHIAGDHHNQ